MDNYLITKSDLENVISRAKDNMNKMNLPIYLSGKPLEKTEIIGLAVFEAALNFLNSKKLLTTDINLDYTDPSCDHDGEEL